MLGVLLAPITSIVGTIYGALAAKSPEKVEAAARMLQTTGQAAEVQYHIRDLLIAELNREQFGGVVALEEVDRAKPPIDTVVEVWINGITLTAPGEFNINPGLRLHVSSGMRILRGEIEVGALSLTSEGQSHTLLGWADDDAKTFRAQIARESEKLAKQYLTVLLSRPIPTQQPSVRWGTVVSAGEEGVVVRGEEDGKEATWIFVADSKTVIRRDGYEVGASSLKQGDHIIVYTAPGSAVAQLIYATAPRNSSKPIEPAPTETK